MPDVLFAVALFAVVFCTAVNAYTLRIAYPLWRHMDQASFADVHRVYLQRLTPVITVPHVLMFFATCAMLRVRPAGLGFGIALAVFLLSLAVILVSAFVAGPVHDRFARQEAVDEPGMQRLIGVSALRTVLMLAASGLLLGEMVRGSA